jgi:hypothetical protein
VVPAAKAPKYLMKAGKSALRAGQASKGASGFTDAVAVAKQGSGLMDRGASVASKAQAGAKPAAIGASEKAVAKEIDLRVKPKVSRVKDGSRTVEGTQVHHIIPQKIKNHPVLKKIGFNIDQLENKMFLPTVKGDKLLNVERSYHQGGHMEKYYQKLEKALDKIYNDPKLSRYSHEEINNKVHSIIQKERALLRSGDTPLNKNHRPQAKDTYYEWLQEGIVKE